MISWGSDFPQAKGVTYLGVASELNGFEGMVNGDTFYAVDLKTLYVYYDDEWWAM